MMDAAIVLQETQICAEAWKSNVRLVGNVSAGELARAIGEALTALAEVAALRAEVERLQAQLDAVGGPLRPPHWHRGQLLIDRGQRVLFTAAEVRQWTGDPDFPEHDAERIGEWECMAKLQRSWHATEAEARAAAEKACGVEVK